MQSWQESAVSGSPVTSGSLRRTRSSTYCTRYDRFVPKKVLQQTWDSCGSGDQLPEDLFLYLNGLNGRAAYVCVCESELDQTPSGMAYNA